MLVYATFCWANRGTQRDRPVSRRLHSVHGRAHDCLGRALFGGEFADRLAQSRRPHGSAGSHHARGIWPDLRYKLSRSGSLTLAGAERMLVFPCSDLTCACLPPVPQWAVRTSLDTLGLSRFSHWACPDGFRGACLSSLCTDWLLTTLVSLSALATIAIVQIYRYRHLSSPLQQQQTKWVVFGIAASITVVVSGIAPTLIFPTVASSGSL